MRGEFDMASFYAALDAHRVSRGLNWKDVARESGVSQSTLTRISQGRRPDIDGLALLLTWSGLNAADFLKNRPGEPEPLAQVTALLRADKNLNRESAEALEEIIKVAYGRFKEK